MKRYTANISLVQFRFTPEEVEEALRSKLPGSLQDVGEFKLSVHADGSYRMSQLPPVRGWQPDPEDDE